MMMVVVVVSMLAIPITPARIVAMDPMMIVVMTGYPHVEISGIPIVRAVIVRLIPNRD